MLVCQIEKRLGSFHLSIDLRVGDHVTALFGPSGSGKSLTLQAIAGLMTPDSGEIQVGGQTVYDSSRGINLPPQQRRTGYVFQNYALFPHLTVAENIGYGLHRLARAEREQRVAAAIASVRLKGLERRRPAQLSGGQQQRVALARALVTRPAVLLLDEPFAALDQSIRLELHGQLLDLLQELAVPTLLVTHQLEEAYALSRTIAVYEAGRIHQIGTREAVYGQPQARNVAAQVGFRNELAGIVTAVSAGQTVIDGQGFPILGPETPFQQGQRVVCTIRPEHVMLVRKEAPGRERGETVIPGRILHELVYGGDVMLHFRPDAAGEGESGADLQISLPTYVYDRMGLAAEKRWEVALRPEYIRVFAASEQR
ncbi:MAG TPA: ABC transporter ATP-binding protein [Symbiobacteriaceae bacterium]|nr:ABC transporter ATP-binding protein [Symbiobacteriaceae bacterium]